MNLAVAHVLPFVTQRHNGVVAAAAGLNIQLQRVGVSTEVWNVSDEGQHFSQRLWGPENLRVIDLPRASSFSGRLAGVDFRRTLDWVHAQRARIDLLHFHGVFQLEAHRIAKLGLPYVITPQGGYSPSALRGKPKSIPKKLALWLLSERRFLERARLVHVLSNQESLDIRDLGIRNRTEVIPNAVDVPPDPRDLRAGAPGYFLFVGRLAVHHKGLDRLIDGYALARRRQRVFPSLVIAGPDHEGGLSQLRRMVQSLDLGGSVTFPGPVEGPVKRELLAAARVFVHTSRFEGIPSAVLEALALGVPALVTRGTNLSEIVSSARAGWSSGDDASAIAEALTLAASSSDKDAQEIGQRAHRLAREQFDWAAVRGSYIRLYEAALSS